MVLEHVFAQGFVAFRLDYGHPCGSSSHECIISSQVEQNSFGSYKTQQKIFLNFHNNMLYQSLTPLALKTQKEKEKISWSPN